jgi:hypothetical protein
MLSDLYVIVHVYIVVAQYIYIYSNIYTCLYTYSHTYTYTQMCIHNEYIGVTVYMYKHNCTMIADVCTTLNS